MFKKTERNTLLLSLKLLNEDLQVLIGDYMISQFASNLMEEIENPFDECSDLVFIIGVQNCSKTAIGAIRDLGYGTDSINHILHVHEALTHTCPFSCKQCLRNRLHFISFIFCFFFCD